MPIPVYMYKRRNTRILQVCLTLAVGLRLILSGNRDTHLRKLGLGQATGT